MFIDEKFKKENIVFGKVISNIFNNKININRYYKLTNRLCLKVVLEK